MTLDEHLGAHSDAAAKLTGASEDRVLKRNLEVGTNKILMPIKQPTILDRLADVTATLAKDWEVLDGPDSRVGVDYWYRHQKTGVEAYLNLDQDHLTISVAGERVYEGLHSILP